ncbi:hypothetical protein Zm00014a_002975 [Zea mays]|uniref:Uncharacterized protein n=1 Tax=Zea mays TaxID=4577 RepID=A0A3L6F1Y5_MAIZE|nr:hypothetical protein Zm00014a_002975 [Zea mays]
MTRLLSIGKDRQHLEEAKHMKTSSTNITSNNNFASFKPLGLTLEVAKDLAKKLCLATKARNSALVEKVKLSQHNDELKKSLAKFKRDLNKEKATNEIMSKKLKLAIKDKDMDEEQLSKSKEYFKLYNRLEAILDQLYNSDDAKEWSIP